MTLNIQACGGEINVAFNVDSFGNDDAELISWSNGVDEKEALQFVKENMREIRAIAESERDAEKLEKELDF